jgi:CRP-like cAMP-binding protein
VAQCDCFQQQLGATSGFAEGDRDRFIARHRHARSLSPDVRITNESCGSSFEEGQALGLHQRIAIVLFELCSDFGIEESRGTLLRVSFSHKDIANLVGASRRE